MITKGQKITKRERRHRRVRSQVSGNALRPRLAVFRSNKYIYAQIIDDTSGQTLVSANDLKRKDKKIASAKLVGETLAKLALGKKIKQVAFDRGGYLYTGRVKELAEGARSGGLEF